MTTDRLVTALMGGISDSMTLPHLAMLMALGAFFFAARNAKGVSGDFFSRLVFGYLLTAFLSRVGVFNALFLTEGYYRLAAVFFMIAGLWLIIIGIAFACGWYAWYRGGRPLRAVFKTGRLLCGAWDMTFVTGFLCGIVAAGFVSSWPVNVSVAALSAEIVMPGVLWQTLWSLLLYEAVIVAVMGVFFFAVRYCLEEKQREVLNRYRSLLLCVLAGCYMAIGFGLAAVFVMR